jgi:hypothetical protein
MTTCPFTKYGQLLFKLLKRKCLHIKQRHLPKPFKAQWYGTMRFNIQKLCTINRLHFCVLNGTQNKQGLFAYIT